VLVAKTSSNNFGLIPEKDMQTLNAQPAAEASKADILVLDRFGRVLVEVKDGFDFELRSTDLTNAVTFDHAAAADVLSRLEHLAVSHGPFANSTVRDFKMRIIDSFGTQEGDAAELPSAAHRM
jgi:hypothetical protein